MDNVEQGEHVEGERAAEEFWRASARIYAAWRSRELAEAWYYYLERAQRGPGRS